MSSEWGIRDTPKWPGRLQCRERDSKEVHNRLAKEGYGRFWWKEELNGTE